MEKDHDTQPSTGLDRKFTFWILESICTPFFIMMLSSFPIQQSHVWKTFQKIHEYQVEDKHKELKAESERAAT